MSAGRFTSFDHLVGERDQFVRDLKSELLRSLQLDRQLEFGRLLNRNVARPSLHEESYPLCWSNQRSPCIKLDTMFTVSANTVTLKKNEATPCAVVSLRIVLLVI